MRTREFRITMPVDVKEYHLAQMWSFAEQSKQETGGGEGVEILKNEEFTNGNFYGGKYTSGQYTYKLYHIETKIPTLFRYSRFQNCSTNSKIFAFAKKLHSIIRIWLLLQNFITSAGGRKRLQASRGSLERVPLLQDCDNES